ncbi:MULTISPECIES: RNA chaperone Hfq [Proteiniclasticum]|uniref:RNA-binding protein Hfq n=1 Tax=Proteiniclasticum ruminis TaxID=398199 RepID=A0A1G8MYI9_9CLOT|nr:MULTISPECIES: RNA chaperone Hfq [Proteiniclasticum]MBP9920749.1 RNA chaperone Hfq [Proteiniclasticum sp.]SDI73041.1 host factor-I protein [Proteiniclasticum ruminis]
MSKAINNFQDVFLNGARKTKMTVTIHLVNGFQLKGMVRGFDNYVIVLETEDKQMLVYKHAVTTITPLKPILILDEEE